MLFKAVSLRKASLQRDLKGLRGSRLSLEATERAGKFGLAMS